MSEFDFNAWLKVIQLTENVKIRQIDRESSIMGYGKRVIIFTCCVLSFFLINLLPVRLLNIEKVVGKEILCNEYTDDLVILKKASEKKSSHTIKPVVSVNSNKNIITSIPDINISIYQNQRNFLPRTVKAKYSDGKTREVKVLWEDDIIDTSIAGKYIIEGKVGGYRNKVKCIISIEPLEIIITKLVILPEESYDKTEADRITERISKIYPGILNRLLKKNIHIKLINTPITELPEYGYLKGMLPRGWEGTGKTWDDVPGVSGNPVAIRIGYSEPGRGHGAVNLELHEIAHAVDSYLFNGISGTKEFKNIWSKEAEDLFGNNSYFLNYPDEYFAEAFAMFYLEGEYKYDLSYRAPLTFKFFEELEEKTN